VFGLSFLSPLFLAGTAAVAIPLALHLFFRRAEPVVDFAAMRYLRSAPVEKASRRRFKEWLLLALRCAALLLLALAFARPYLTQSAAALVAPATVVVVDTSASMSAPGQLAAAQAKAVEIVRGIAPAEAVAVIDAGGGADVVAPLATDHAPALEAVASLKPGAGANRYRAALARAAELIGDRQGRIVVVTDLQASGWDAGEEGSIPERVDVSIVEIASPVTNIAVTALRIDGGEAVATVQNFSPKLLAREVSYAVDGRRVGGVAVNVPPGGTTEARLMLNGRGSGALSATVDDREGYQADNVRYAVLDASSIPLVLAVTSSGTAADAFFLERAIEVAEGSSGFRLQRVSGQQFSGMTSEALGETDAIVILGTRGIEHQGRERLAAYVRDGGGVLVTTAPDVDPAVVREALNGVATTTWKERTAATLRFAPDDRRHPIFRPFGGVGALANVSFTRTTLLAAAPGAEVLARYSDGSAAVVEEAAGGGRILFFASDLNNRWNDLPVQPAFVPFLHEMLRYLAASPAARADYVVGDLPGTLGSAPGVVRAGGTTGRLVAVNVDTRESDPSRMTAEAFHAAVTRLNARAVQQATTEVREREDTHRLWQYGLLLMVVSLAAESMVGRRLG
jgi:hypothetical protein